MTEEKANELCEKINKVELFARKGKYGKTKVYDKPILEASIACCHHDWGKTYSAQVYNTVTHKYVISYDSEKAFNYDGHSFIKGYVYAFIDMDSIR